MQPPALEPNRYVVTKDFTYRIHAEKQYQNLQEQANLLIRQAEEIRKRVALADHIHSLKFNFKPVLLKTYYLYDKGLSIISPQEWNHEHLGSYHSAVRQLGDGTWETI